MKLKHLAMAVALGLSLPQLAYANTSSALRGVITTPQGTAAAGTKVVIVHVPTGTRSAVVVNEAGLFNAVGLRVGGPYRVEVDSDVYADQTFNDIFLSLGETSSLNVRLEAESNVERIQVAGSRLTQGFSGDSGPTARFGLETLETAPAINRDIKDVIRIDPRIYINEGNSGSIQCAGGSPRSNSLTVDGVKMNDNFGLNSNGYPTERIPFSLDAIEQVAVELAPFDVNYGGFTSCNINAVTKGGSNKVTGSVFMDYTSDTLKGDKLESEKIDTGSYNEKRYGFNVGLPLVKDKLFAFVAYEKLDGAQVFQYSPFDNGRISQAQLDDVIRIAKDVYNYDPGTMVPSMPVEDEKLLIKLDWNINELHRANLVYNYNDGFTIDQSDANSTRLSLSNHFYERGSKLTSWVTSLYSDWTPDFSTEVKLGYAKLDMRQQSLDAASGFGEMQVGVGGVTVYLGPDDSRQSNKLKYDNLSFKLAATWHLNEHELYFGYEYENLDAFNLFVQNSVGQYRFTNLTDFENGLARVYYGNASSHNPNDAAGEFEYDIHTLYVQDKYLFVEHDLTITAGLRYDWYSSSDVPAHNAKFEQRYGFSNQQNLDGKDLLQPRFGFNWGATDKLEIRGGAGLFSGGNPNVWVSNSYSNDGVRNIQINQRNISLLGPNADLIGQGRPGYDIPKELYDFVGSGITDATTNVTDPNFKIPSEWKYALGATYVTDSDYVLSADLLYSRKKNSAIIKDLSTAATGTTPDGRPAYDTRGSFNDFILTNHKGKDGRTTTLSLSASKAFDNGVDAAISYAYTRAKDVHPMTSSVAFSNYHNVAAYDTENLQLATSNYEIPHRFTLNLGYSTELFDGYNTRFSLFGQALQTNSYGYTFHNNSTGFGYNDNSRQVLYIPLAGNDPLVTYGSAFDVEAFNNFIAAEGLDKYRGSVVPRNALDGSWWVKFDARIEQEFAGFTPEHKGSIYFVIENIGNLLNDDWGVLKEGDSLTPAVTATVENGQYSYNTFHNPASESRLVEPSLWKVRLGVKYKF